MRNLIQEFLETKIAENGVALNTIQAYRGDLKKFTTMIAPKLPQDLKPEDLEKYLKQLKEERCSAKSLARKISCLREYYKFLLSEKIIKENPASRLKLPKTGKPLPFYLSQEEIEKLCGNLPDVNDFSAMRMYLMIKLMYYCGLRVSELVSLPENAINFDLKQIFICGKGSKERMVPVAKNVIDDISPYLDSREKFLGKVKSKWLFPSLHSISGHITRAAFFKRLKKMSAEAGLDAVKIHPHTLRHSFATQMINKEVDLRSVQKMLGHENIATTEIYTHITTEKLANIVKTKHPLMHIKK